MAFRVGTLVYVRYLDHVLFREMDPKKVLPFGRECVGWLDYDHHEYVRLTWERSTTLHPPKETETKATGLVILKKAILEMRRIG